MSQDLQKAINWARERAAARSAVIPSGRVGCMISYYTHLADAAQKWLDAQPKPQWRVRAWREASDRVEVRSHLWPTYADARQAARDAINDDAYRVEITREDNLPASEATGGGALKGTGGADKLATSA